MISTLFQAIFYKPLYNGLIFLFHVLPWADAGLIVILFTVLVKLILFPLSKKSVETQMIMKKIQPELDALKNKHKDNREEQARAMMALYKEKKLNPLAGIFLVIIQIPIILALYWVFLNGGLPQVNAGLLYNFVPVPDLISMNFFGLLDISQKSIFVALLAGVSQFFQMRYALPATPAKSDKPSFKDDLARSMSMQMKYVMPVFIIIIAYQLPAVVGFYWVTSNLFAIGQEIVVRRRYRLDQKPA
ncbi:MAG: YidC/Oxa1 family membrane protein insertase [Candidatus Paceibacterota bacterium]|jgi:YidC/Oxa1 family membrane protein insertase